MTRGIIAVLDVGKTNVKLWVATEEGALLESASTANPVRAGPPWAHHDLPALGEWVGTTLAALCRRHPLRVLIPVGHGSGGVMIDGDGPAFPMIDYEQPCPPEIDALYANLAGSFEDRGSPIMMASTHAARQMLWMEQAAPAEFANATHYLNVAQYWAWWLSGVAASELSAMGAQSHLWNTPQGHWTPIVTAREWKRLLPAFKPACQRIGPIRYHLQQLYGVPGIDVLAGAHDSSANLYRYTAAGLADFTLVSTGTWIVAMSRDADVAALNPLQGTTINADMDGRPVGGALVMGGREFSLVAGPDRADGADLQVLKTLVGRGTMALPSFGDDAGQFSGSARRGRIVGPPPESAMERTTLAVLYAALLTVACARALGGGARLVLDGTFLQEPLYAPLVATFWEGPVAVSAEAQGVVAGAVRLAGGRATPDLSPVKRLEGVPRLAEYAKTWRTASEEPHGRA